MSGAREQAGAVRLLYLPLQTVCQTRCTLSPQSHFIAPRKSLHSGENGLFIGPALNHLIFNLYLSFPNPNSLYSFFSLDTCPFSI